jgi:hypothetical protein
VGDIPRWFPARKFCWRFARSTGGLRQGPGVLVELGVVEQWYRVVLEVLEEGVP